MKSAVANLLRADTTLMALLSGGLHTTVEISRQTTPTAFDGNKELLPCGLIKAETVNPTAVIPHTGTAWLLIYLYERAGAGVIESARQRIFTLLHNQLATPLSGSAYPIHWDGDMLDQWDDQLSVDMILTRYRVAFARGV